MLEHEINTLLARQVSASRRNINALAESPFAHAREEVLALWKMLEDNHKELGMSPHFGRLFQYGNSTSDSLYYPPRASLELYERSFSWFEERLTATAERNRRRAPGARALLSHMSELLERIRVYVGHMDEPLGLLTRHFRELYFYDTFEVRRRELMSSKARRLRDKAYREGLSITLFEQYESQAERWISCLPRERDEHKRELRELTDTALVHLLLGGRDAQA